MNLIAPTGAQQSDAELLRSASRESLAELVLELQAFLRTQAQTLAEIIDERDAARLLNELCHY